jgi:hypothetical protein
MDDVEPVEISSLRDADVAVELAQPSIEDEQWVFRQGQKYPDWAGIFKSGWWRHRDDFSDIYTHAEDKNDDVRITLYHRPKENREQAVRDRLLEVQLWHATGQDDFANSFKEKLTSKVNKRDTEIPPSVSVTGNRGKPLTATYDIPVREQDDFFEEYVAALAEAYRDLVIENREIITLIDEAYEESLEVFD